MSKGQLLERKAKLLDTRFVNGDVGHAIGDRGASVYEALRFILNYSTERLISLFLRIRAGVL